MMIGPNKLQWAGFIVVAIFTGAMFAIFGAVVYYLAV